MTLDGNFQHETCGYAAPVRSGMADVAICVTAPGFIVDEGAKPVRITRGTEIGRVEFGGSTHMMIFQRDPVQVAPWALDAAKHQNDPNPAPMGTRIATRRASGGLIDVLGPRVDPFVVEG